MKTELLIQMQGLINNGEKVFVLAASNIPWDLDDAMLRRLEKRVKKYFIKILVDLPNHLARKDMVVKLVGDRTASDIDFEEIAHKLEGYSGSDIYGVCKEAAMTPLRKLLFQLEGIELDENQKSKPSKFKPRPKEEVISPDPVSIADFDEAIKNVKRAPGGNIKKYIEWN